MQQGNGWRDRLLRLLARGLLQFEERPVDMRLLATVLDRILGDPELDRRLDHLNDAELKQELVRLYAEAVHRSDVR